MKSWKKEEVKMDLIWRKKALECATSFGDKKAMKRIKAEVEKLEKLLED